MPSVTIYNVNSNQNEIRRVCLSLWLLPAGCVWKAEACSEPGANPLKGSKRRLLTVSSCRLFFFFFFFLPQQLESTSLLGDSLPSSPSSSWPPISRAGGSSSSRRYDRFLRVQMQFSTIWAGQKEAAAHCLESKCQTTVATAGERPEPGAALQINWPRYPIGSYYGGELRPGRRNLITRCLSSMKIPPPWSVNARFSFDIISIPCLKGSERFGGHTCLALNLFVKHMIWIRSINFYQKTRKKKESSLK